jgi:hypothetical protein
MYIGFVMFFSQQGTTGQRARKRRRRGGGGPKLPHNTPSFTIETPLAHPHSFASPRPLAHTTRTETEIDFPVGLTPPNPKLQREPTQNVKGLVKT